MQKNSMDLRENVSGVASDFDLEPVKERAAIQEESGVELDGAELMISAALEPDDWMIEGLIERGDQVVIAGAPKAGKSVLALQLALAVAQGGRFLGWSAPRARTALYINLEIKKKRMGRRFVAAAGGIPAAAALAGKVLFLNSKRTVNISDPKERRELRDLIAKSGAEFVVWDVLARMHSVDEMSPEMKSVMLSIRVASADLAHVVVHHTRKPPQDSESAQTAYDIRGSSAIHGEVDLAMILSRRAGQGARYAMTFSARNVDTPDEMLLDMVPDRMIFERAEESEENRLREVLQAAFAGDAVMLAGDLERHIMDAYLVAARQSTRYIRQAVDSGWLRRERGTDKRYRYHLTDDSPVLRVVRK